MKHIKVLISVLFLISGQMVFAKNTIADYKPGIYVGIQSGLALLTNTSAVENFMDKYYELNDAKSKEESKSKYGVKFLLGYSFSPYFACDLGLGLYPSHEIIALKSDGNGLRYKRDLRVLDLSGKGILPLEVFSSSLIGWNIYGKLGLAAHKHSFIRNVMKSSGVVHRTISNDQDGNLNIGLSYAFGITYNFNDHFGIDLSWSSLYLGKSGEFSYDKGRDEYVFEGGVPSLNFFALGVTYKF